MLSRSTLKGESVSSPIRTFFETIWLLRKGFRPVEFVCENDRVSLHPSGWRVNGSGRFKRAKDAVDYLESASPEQWRQIYCGMTPFLVSDKGNVKHVDGSPVKMNLANGRYQIMYKPEDPRGRGKDGRIHKKRVYRSMLVAMAWLDFRKGDAEHEIHHINGYRTDDRVANLMVVDHEEHLRIHGLGPCGLSGLPDARIVDAPAGHENGGEEAETFTGAHVALKPEGSEDESKPCKKKRRRGKRGGKNRSAQQSEKQPASEAENADGRTGAEPEAPEAGGECEQGGVELQAAPEERTSNESTENADTADACNDAAATCGEKGARRGRKRRKKNRDAAMCEGALEPETGPENSGEAANRDAGGEGAQHDGASPCGDEATKPTKRSRTRDDAGSKTKPAHDEDWNEARKRLADALDGFLEAIEADDAGNAIDEKEVNKAAKPVYRALKPYLTCPDAVAAFDAALSSIRTIAQAYRDSKADMPAPVHSMLGTLHQVVKDAVKRIAAEGDAVETACLKELLVDEAAKPLFKKTMHARKFRQCISIVDSRNESEPEQA